MHGRCPCAQLNLDSLRAAFADINADLDDVSRFRMEALPQMASTVLELDRITSVAESSIQQLEKGNQARPELRIELE